jgi:hypothetical protein
MRAPTTSQGTPTLIAIEAERTLRIGENERRRHRRFVRHRTDRLPRHPGESNSGVEAPDRPLGPCGWLAQGLAAAIQLIKVQVYVDPREHRSSLHVPRAIAGGSDIGSPALFESSAEGTTNGASLGSKSRLSNPCRRRDRCTRASQSAYSKSQLERRLLGDLYPGRLTTHRLRAIRARKHRSLPSSSTPRAHHSSNARRNRARVGRFRAPSDPSSFCLATRRNSGDATDAHRGA